MTAFKDLFLRLGTVALLADAVGIANIMVVPVLGRRQEIGLRWAPGATRGQIRAQFLAEAILLSPRRPCHRRLVRRLGRKPGRHAERTSRLPAAHARRGGDTAASAAMLQELHSAPGRFRPSRSEFTGDVGRAVIPVGGDHVGAMRPSGDNTPQQPSLTTMT